MKKVLLFFVLILLSACASVPMESLEKDSRAKEFMVDPAKANIYLYRNENFGGAIAINVTLDGKVAGKTAAKTFFLWQVEPGTHEIASLSENTSKISIDAKAGTNSYIWQEIKMGMWTAGSQLHEVTEEEGKKAINECKLIKSEL